MANIFTDLMWYLTFMQTTSLCIQTIFWLFELLFTAKVLLNGHAVTQTNVSVVYQSESTETNPHGYLIRHFKETIVLKSIKHFTKTCQPRSIYV